MPQVRASAFVFVKIALCLALRPTYSNLDRCESPSQRFTKYQLRQTIKSTCNRRNQRIMQESSATKSRAADIVKRALHIPFLVSTLILFAALKRGSACLRCRKLKLVSLSITLRSPSLIGAFSVAMGLNPSARGVLLHQGRVNASMTRPTVGGMSEGVRGRLGVSTSHGIRETLALVSGITRAAILIRTCQVSGTDVSTCRRI